MTNKSLTWTVVPTVARVEEVPFLELFEGDRTKVYDCLYVECREVMVVNEKRPSERKTASQLTTMDLVHEPDLVNSDFS